MRMTACGNQKSLNDNVDFIDETMNKEEINTVISFLFLTTSVSLDHHANTSHKEVSIPREER